MGNCPSKQILSVYFDGELPHPFDGKVREHIDVCSSCKNEIAGFVKLSENMLKPENVIYNTAKTRIWSKLSVRSMPVQKRHYISIPV
ncbi:MAG: zf-HC2 domain-containing protein, partial [Spirochaetaceae bacterium]|nr:zf-HC2 domain-containing protein [Spirochaetaceae bacterium]